MFRYTAPTENTVSEREQTHRLFSQKIAEVGMVLLKNDGRCRWEEQSTIALFGYGAVETAVSGSGAGGVHNRKTVSVLEGLKAGGVRITTEAYLQKLAAGLETAHTEYYAEIKRKCGSNYLAGVRDMYANPFGHAGGTADHRGGYSKRSCNGVHLCAEQKLRPKGRIAKMCAETIGCWRVNLKICGF